MFKNGVVMYLYMYFCSECVYIMHMHITRLDIFVLDFVHNECHVYNTEIQAFLMWKVFISTAGSSHIYGLLVACAYVNTPHIASFLFSNRVLLFKRDLASTSPRV